MLKNLKIFGIFKMSKIPDSSYSAHSFLSVLIDQLHVVGIYHVLKAHNFPEFLGYVI